MSDRPIQIHLLRDKPQHFDAVVSLGDRHKSKLGLFPAGALQESANAGWVLVACDDTELMGYLLYRVSSRHPRRVTLIHLCVEPAYRARGIARLLVESLQHRTRELPCIRLLCRRDYDENKLWPRLGFHLLGEKPGRGVAGTPLNIWAFDHSNPVLTAISKAISEQRIIAALDANVVFDFDSNALTSLESHALMSDWLAEHIHMFITPELSIEISRCEDPSSRERSRSTAARFMVLSAPMQPFHRAMQTLETILGQPKDDNETSDLRQIAWSVAGGAEYFVTRDQLLLDAREAVQDALNIAIVRPSEIITEFDEVINRLAYQPGRFDGSRLSKRGVGARDENRLIELYLDTKAGEKKWQFAELLRIALSTQPGSISEIAGDQGYVLYQILHSASDVEIPILRATSDRLSPTVVRQLLTSLGFQHPGCAIRITEKHIGAVLEDALIETRFSRCNDAWLKLCPRYIGPVGDVKSFLGTVFPSDMLDFVRTTLAIQSGSLECERMLSPAKFTDIHLPCYIIPIRSPWAAQLFDIGLARQELFGISPELGFSLENVYYRAAQGSLAVPARILWYVSKKGSSYSGAGSIRAASYLDEVIVGPPKQLFSRFKRLGVYTWAEIYSLARQSVENNIMALRFSGTELLSQPIAWDALQSALQAHMGRRNQVQSPIQITQELFFDLYSRATAQGTPR